MHLLNFKWLHNILISGAKFTFSNNATFFVIKRKECPIKFHTGSDKHGPIKNRVNKYQFSGCRESWNADISEK